MPQRLKAIYHSGAFVPQVPCDLPENAEVELIIQDSYMLPPQVTEPREREQILKAMLERMQQNPWPADLPRFTRDALYERG
jgi:hypothetical protein